MTIKCPMCTSSRGTLKAPVSLPGGAPLDCPLCRNSGGIREELAAAWRLGGLLAAQEIDMHVGQQVDIFAGIYADAATGMCGNCGQEDTKAHRAKLCGKIPELANTPLGVEAARWLEQAYRAARKGR